MIPTCNQGTAQAKRKHTALDEHDATCYGKLANIDGIKCFATQHQELAKLHTFQPSKSLNL